MHRLRKPIALSSRWPKRPNQLRDGSVARKPWSQKVMICILTTAPLGPPSSIRKTGRCWLVTNRPATGIDWSVR